MNELHDTHGPECEGTGSDPRCAGSEATGTMRDHPDSGGAGIDSARPEQSHPESGQTEVPTDPAPAIDADGVDPQRPDLRPELGCDDSAEARLRRARLRWSKQLAIGHLRVTAGSGASLAEIARKILWGFGVPLFDASRIMHAFNISRGAKLPYDEICRVFEREEDFPDEPDRPRGWRVTPGAERFVDLHEEESDDRPTIQVTTDEFDVNTTAIAALAADLEIYVRGQHLVMVRRDARPPKGMERDQGVPQITSMARPIIRERLSKNAKLYAEKETKDGPVVKPAHPPEWCVKAIEARGDYPGIRPIEAVVEGAHPAPRRDRPGNARLRRRVRIAL